MYYKLNVVLNQFNIFKKIESKTLHFTSKNKHIRVLICKEPIYYVAYHSQLDMFS